MAKQTKGFCKYCGKEYTKSGMLKHLAACKKRKVKLEEEKIKTKSGYFQIVITGKYSKVYWLIIEVNENITLKELDKFIRDIWVECCGHLSLFEINGVEYERYPSEDRFWGSPAKNMNYRLRDIVQVGDTMNYEYDFGSTTELVLNIHSYRIGEKKGKQLVILSRNNLPEILCGQCETNKAKWINPEDFWEGNPFLCEECCKKIILEEYEMEDGEELEEDYNISEFFSEICNSPRMGVCGYEGSSIYPEYFEPDEK